MARQKVASKAGPTTPTVADEEPPPAYPVHLVKSALLLIILGFISLAVQLALHPLYGSTPTSLNHSKVELLACLLSVLLPVNSPSLSEPISLFALATWSAYAPYASYALAKWTSNWKNPVLGSGVTEVMVLLPLVTIGVALVRRWNTTKLGFLPGPMSVKAVVAISAFNFLNRLEAWLWGHLPLGGYIHSANILVTAAALLVVGAAISQPKGQVQAQAQMSRQASAFKPSVAVPVYKRLLPCLLPMFAAFLALSVPPSATPRMPYMRGSASSRSSLVHPPATVRVLARTHSITGLILVGEHVEEGFRFLRVDHSLLGGRWMGAKVAPGSRNDVGDSIYSTFVLQEAVRLGKNESQNAENERALFIGLGVGIAAEAFIAHGINTTIVEIDPAVYAYAREYFSLPEPAQVYIEDAGEWVQDHASLAEDDKYDYVVHDCFSGGAVPEHIFTLEFWESLKKVVKPDGVLAVNFAGKLASEPARAIFLTLQRSFGRCRAFHDHLSAEFDVTYEFFNVVLFCTPLSATPPAFRKRTNADYLSSRLRRHILSELERREIEPERLLGLDLEPGLLEEGEEQWILREGGNRLEEWQKPNAVEHWTVMREVLPDVFWETY
ncbi:hypothetical protein K439DRAFT_1633655 [Ramaria rubella]|nr:hypothetical protein K439DRAFT_1633655 [Ramaria rubella]